MAGFLQHKNQAISKILTKARFGKEISSDELLMEFYELSKFPPAEREKMCAGFGRELAKWKNEHNVEQYEMHKKGHSFILILSDAKGYFAVTDKEGGIVGRNFYYGRVKDVIQQTKIIDELLLYQHKIDFKKIEADENQLGMF